MKKDFEFKPNYIEENEITNKEEILQSIKIELSLNDLYNIDNLFITNLGLLPHLLEIQF